jgi:hypothetical protein
LFSPEQLTIKIERTTKVNTTIPTIETEILPAFSTPLEATHAAPTRSHRYGFISTQQIINSFEEAGYTPRSVQLARSNKAETRGFQKHLIRFQHRDLTTIDGQAAPEFILFNSHDGTTSARLSLGLQVFACLNGLVSGQFLGEVKVYHRSVDVNHFLEAATSLRDKVPLLTQKYHLFNQRQLTSSEVTDFTANALALRYSKPAEDSPLEDRLEWENRLYYANRARRYADSGSSLWQTFNRVQENLVKGGRRGSGIRRLTAPAIDYRLNQQLWDLAENYLNN